MINRWPNNRPRSTGYSIAGPSTRPRRKTLARVRREQAGVQLRVEPDSLAYLTTLGERACGGCGMHVCGCAQKAAAVPAPTGWTYHEKDCQRFSFCWHLDGHADVHVCRCAKLPDGSYLHIAVVGTNDRLGLSFAEAVTWAEARAAMQPQAAPGAQAVQIGDVWRHNVETTTVATIKAVVGDIAIDASGAEYSARLIPIYWTLLSRATPAQQSPEEVLRAAGFVPPERGYHVWWFGSVWRYPCMWSDLRGWHVSSPRWLEKSFTDIHAAIAYARGEGRG